MSDLNFEQSPEEISLERQSHIDSILMLLKQSLDKLRISLILPKIFENTISARQYLQGSKYANCIDLIEEYIVEKNTNPTDTPPHLNYRLIKIIDYFHENIQVLDYFYDWLNDLKPVDISLLEAFQLLLTITEQRLKRRARSELNKERKIHEVYEINKKIRTNLLVLDGILKTTKIRMTWRQAMEEAMIQKFEEKMVKSKYENNAYVKEQLLENSGNIRQIQISCAAKEKEIEEDLQRTVANYESVLKGSLAKEKSARAEKNKLLLQLETLVRKFDSTMLDKTRKHLYLLDDLKQQRGIFENFMIGYNLEEAEYDRLVLSKEREEKRQRDAKIMLFILNRSARIIQRQFRKFNRALKKARKQDMEKPKKKK